MPDAHIGRMLVERYDLSAKMIALDSFINQSPIFPTLPEDEQDDMKKQLQHMGSYQYVLERRIRRADPEGTAP